MIRDPKDFELHREVGWVRGNFVELVICLRKKQFEISVLVGGDLHSITTSPNAVDAMTIFDSLEHDAFKIMQQEQGVSA